MVLGTMPLGERSGGMKPIVCAPGTISVDILRSSRFLSWSSSGVDPTNFSDGTDGGLGGAGSGLVEPVGRRAGFGTLSSMSRKLPLLPGSVGPTRAAGGSPVSGLLIGRRLGVGKDCSLGSGHPEQVQFRHGGGHSVLFY